MPNVRRSFHPTHPCAALGPKADELIDGSELSVTPFGRPSTYGRFSERDDAVLLLIQTNNTSMVDRFQEIVDMPNLFLPQLFEVEGKDQAGKTNVLFECAQSRLALVRVLAASGSGEAQYIWFPDYVVHFPRLHAERIHARLTAAEAKPFLKTRQAQFFETKVFRQASHGKAELLAPRKAVAGSHLSGPAT